MSFFVVPFDYREESHSSIIPICIADTDSEGIPVNRAWVERGVVPVADPLRSVANRELGDPWRVSEITEPAVHWLNRKHQGRLPANPSHRVLSQARSYAADLRVGGRRARRRADVELLAATLENLREQRDPATDLLAKDTVNRLLKALEREGLHDIRVMALMMMWDDAPSEFETRFQLSRNALSHRFFRVMRRVAAAHGITW
jgi:hypothetical protein